MDGCRSFATQCQLRGKVRGLPHPKSGSRWSHGAGTASGCVGMSTLGSMLPSALQGGLSTSSARESLPAPAPCHGAGTSIHTAGGKDKLFLFHKNFCVWLVWENAEVKHLSDT